MFRAVLLGSQTCGAPHVRRALTTTISHFSQHEVVIGCAPSPSSGSASGGALPSPTTSFGLGVNLDQRQHILRGRNQTTAARTLVSRADAGAVRFSSSAQGASNDPASRHLHRSDQPTPRGGGVVAKKKQENPRVVTGVSIAAGRMPASRTASHASASRSSITLASTAGGFTSTSPRDLVKSELRGLASNIRSILGADHPALKRVANYFFHQDGKQFRPMVVLLMARALSAADPAAGTEGRILDTQRSLAEITEMIHTASLLHDDVIDGASTRRGIPAAHIAFGNKVAVLGGDFLLAKASICTARLGSLRVVELLSSVIEDLVEGEFLQSSEADRRRSLELDYYLKKSFLKTASLVAKSCQASALLAGLSETHADRAFAYGKHLGIAFQVVDDLLDFTSSEAELGKPAGSDLASGVVTAPVVFEAARSPEVGEISERGFASVEDRNRIVNLVVSGRAMEETVALAQEHTDAAVEALQFFPEGAHRDALATIARDLAERAEKSLRGYRMAREGGN